MVIVDLWQEERKGYIKMETVKYRKEPNTRPPAWEDSCPSCGEKAIMWCRCFINERTCKNQHTWYWENNQKVMGHKH